MTKKTFYDFGVDARLCDALAEDGITDPFPIQELTLPVALEGHDVIGQARTGSGKTLGFGLPLLHRLDLGRREVQALVVTPTRELCLQVTEDFERAARNTDVRVLPVYGGVPIEPQTDTLRAGVHVVVGTPGRLLDHVRRRNLDLSTCQTLVLDEADEMLDMGFLPDVEQLIAKCSDDRHTMLFSATMPTAVVNLARAYMDRPTFIRAEVEEHTIPDRMEQHFFLVHKLDKPRILARILQSPDRGLAVVFTRTKAMADRLVDDLRNYEIDAVAIHGDLRQATREKNLGKFKSESSAHDVLVATEVAARGLDIDELTHVINYDPPEDEKMYLHRIGRTARAGEKGVAVTFATFAEVDRVNAIRKALDLAKEPIEETFSTSDELTKRFELPSETPWEHLSRTGGSGRSSSSSSRSSSSGGRDRDDSSKDRGKDRGKDRSSRSGSGGGSRSSGGRARGGSSTPSDRDADRGGDRSSRGTAGGRKADTETERAGPSDRNDPAEGIDGSTTKRARTRTRSRDTGSSTGASTEAADGSSSGKARGGDDASTSGSGSGRTRARARRSGGGSDGGGSRGQGGGSGRSPSGSSSARGSSSGRSSGGSSSGSSSGRASDERSRQRSGNGSGGASSGRARSNAASNRNSSEPEPQPGSTPTSAGDDARGPGEPGIVRRVKVEHLP